MHPSIIPTILLVAAVSASPLARSNVEEGSDVFVRSDNITLTAWEADMIAAGVSLETPEIDHDWLNFTASSEDLEHTALAKRAGCKNTAVVVERTETFIDWDVQMSPVVCAVGEMTISVTEGWTVSNGITVSAGVSGKLVGDKLSGSLGINYSKTWTTSASVAVGGKVPDGQCGVMIWKPSTTRRYGSVMEGCVGKMKKVGTFMADDRGTGSYAGINWIAGARSMCIKKGNNPPLSRCQGGGNFV